MENIRELLNFVEATAAKRGVSPASLCRSATGNPRLYERLKARAALTKSDHQRVVDWLIAHPHPAKPKAKA